jgi:hypothetical protein
MGASHIATLCVKPFTCQGHTLALCIRMIPSPQETSHACLSKWMALLISPAAACLTPDPPHLPRRLLQHQVCAWLQRHAPTGTHGCMRPQVHAPTPLQVPAYRDLCLNMRVQVGGRLM